jgi:hypothetical protein
MPATGLEASIRPNPRGVLSDPSVDLRSLERADS